MMRTVTAELGHSENIESQGESRMPYASRTTNLLLH
jgi:hypothetical protein